jgi:hypothetical protein
MQWDFTHGRLMHHGVVHTDVPVVASPQAAPAVVIGPPAAPAVVTHIAALLLPAAPAVVTHIAALLLPAAPAVVTHIAALLLPAAPAALTTRLLLQAAAIIRPAALQVAGSKS